MSQSATFRFPSNQFVNASVCENRSNKSITQTYTIASDACHLVDESMIFGQSSDDFCIADTSDTICYTNTHNSIAS